MQEKFSIFQVASLRGDLRQSVLDSFQLAHAIKMFLGAQGYGISVEMAREVASQLEGSNRNNLESFHRQLESSALMM